MAPNHSKPMTKAELEQEDKENNVKIGLAKRIKTYKYIDSDSSDSDVTLEKNWKKVGIHPPLTQPSQEDVHKNPKSKHD